MEEDKKVVEEAKPQKEEKKSKKEKKKKSKKSKKKDKDTSNDLSTLLVGDVNVETPDNISSLFDSSKVSERLLIFPFFFFFFFFFLKTRSSFRQ
jgi:hypothetical protein